MASDVLSMRVPTDEVLISPRDFFVFLVRAIEGIYLKNCIFLEGGRSGGEKGMFLLRTFRTGAEASQMQVWLTKILSLRKKT